jgi:16S rRNA A1518/A1519 N6-dimethyltransferase RsmA/KsgA/DIM1 with predicted DNA glycosylase/AP lyase activity
MGLLKKHKEHHLPKSTQLKNICKITLTARRKPMKRNYRETLEELLKNQEFKKEYDALEDEFERFTQTKPVPAKFEPFDYAKQQSNIAQ